MRKLILLSGLALTAFFACVKPKTYRAEVLAHQKSEARETVLVKEVLDRRAETTRLGEAVGNLNRTIGNQEAEISDLKKELTSRTVQMGESSSKLITEKLALEKELASTNTILEARNAEIKRVRDVQAKRRKTLDDLKTALGKAFEKTEGSSIAIEDETVQLTLNDKSLFDATGLSVSAAGKNLLTPLANFLAERPELDIDVVAYTDNVLPKDNKTLKDTWEWSLQRATGIVRLLIREYNVNANQLTPVGRGEFYPVTSNETADGRQQNRRTVVVFRPVLATVPSE
jgi:chemotaxis protein MotB